MTGNTSVKYNKWNKIGLNQLNKKIIVVVSFGSVSNELELYLEIRLSKRHAF